MSLDQLATQIYAIRKNAESTQVELGKRAREIADGSDLTDQAKERQLDEEYELAKKDLQDLRKKELDLIASKKNSLQRGLFGLIGLTSNDPNQVILYRDAQDRAARLDNSEAAQEVFDTAMMSDDKTLAAAVLARALKAGWKGIIDAYTKRYPADAEDLTDLKDIENYNPFMESTRYLLLRPDLATSSNMTGFGYNPKIRHHS